MTIDSFITAIDIKEKELAGIKNEKAESYQKTLPLNDVNGHIGYFPFDEIEVALA